MSRQQPWTIQLYDKVLSVSSWNSRHWKPIPECTLLSTTTTQMLIWSTSHPRGHSTADPRSGPERGPRPSCEYHIHWPETIIIPQIRRETGSAKGVELGSPAPCSVPDRHIKMLLRHNHPTRRFSSISPVCAQIICRDLASAVQHRPG
jgi:hypothetical protein